MDLFPFQPVPGLLTPQEQGNVTQNALLSAAAGLLQSAGYSRIPVNTFQALGNGLAGGIQGYKSAMDDALKTEAMRGQIEDRNLNRAMNMRWLAAFGGLPPGLLSNGATPGAPTDSAGASAAPGGTGGPGKASAQPTGLLGVPSSAANGQTTPPVVAAAPNLQPTAAPTAALPGGGSVQSTIAALPPGMRQVIGLMGPQAGMEVLGDYVEKSALPTDPQKNARDPAVAAEVQHEAQIKDDVTRFGKKYDAITTAGDAATALQPQLQLTKSILNDPNFYSGTGAQANLAYKKVLPMIGGDPNAAMPQEVFRNLLKGQILDQIKGLKGTGQIRVSEINLIRQALANPDTTIPGNRTLVEIADRLNNRTLALDDLARNYNGGHLDTGYDTAARNYDAQHPMFSQDELADPRRIAPPTFKTPQTMLNAGLPKGTPFRIAGRPEWGYAP